MRGTSDGTLPEGSLKELLGVLPTARAIEYPGAGHSPFEERPEEFNRDLLAFVQANQRKTSQ